MPPTRHHLARESPFYYEAEWLLTGANFEAIKCIADPKYRSGGFDVYGESFARPNFGATWSYGQSFMQTFVNERNKCFD
jgi:hypothetical protein